MKSLNAKHDIRHSHLNWPANENMYLLAPAIRYLVLLHNAIYPSHRDTETTLSVQNAIYAIPHFSQNVIYPAQQHRTRCVPTVSWLPSSCWACSLDPFRSTMEQFDCIDEMLKQQKEGVKCWTKTFWTKTWIYSVLHKNIFQIPKIF